MQRLRRPLDTISTEKILRIRKIWEIGVEEVLAQTCIQIDGDVVTRLGIELQQASYAGFRESIIDAHRRSVDVSLKHWRGMVDIAVKLVKDVFGFGRKPKI